MITWRGDARRPNHPQTGANQSVVRALVALALVSGLVSSLWAQEVAREAPKRLSVAVLGFENETNDADLAHWRYVTTLLDEPLKKVRAIRVLSEGAVRYAVREVGLRPGDPIDPNRARQMGELIEALRELEEVRRYVPEGSRGVNTVSTVAIVCERLGRRSEAIEYHERTLLLCRRTGVNPIAIRQTETQIQRLKSALTPALLQAPVPERYTEETLEEILRDKLTEDERQMVANPLSCSDAMRQWAKELTRGADQDLDKARAIHETLAARLDTRGPMKSRTARRSSRPGRIPRPASSAWTVPSCSWPWHEPQAWMLSS